MSQELLPSHPYPFNSPHIYSALNCPMLCSGWLYCARVCDATKAIPSAVCLPLKGCLLTWNSRKPYTLLLRTFSLFRDQHSSTFLSCPCFNSWFLYQLQIHKIQGRNRETCFAVSITFAPDFKVSVKRFWPFCHHIWHFCFPFFLFFCFFFIRTVSA